MPVTLLGRFLVYGILLLAIMGMIGTGVYKVKQWGANEVRAEWNADKEKTRLAEQKKALEAATNRETDKTNAKIIYQKIIEHVPTYIDRPVYNSACIDDDGLRDINSALSGKITDQPRTDGGVSKVDPANGINR